MRKIHFSSADKRINISDRKTCIKIISEIFIHEKIKMQEVRFIFCSDKYLLKINKYHLKHNYYTDVISFGLSDINEPVVCEIYLSTERIKENAKSYLTTYQKELLRVMIHGCLHICGYEDDNPNEKEQIRQKENYFLIQYSKFSRET